MNLRQSHTALVAGAIVLLGAGVVAEAIRLVAPWKGFHPTASRVVSVALIAIWVLAAVLLPLRNRPGLASTLARLFAIAAPFAMLSHAAVTRVGGAFVGLTYLAGAILLTVLLGVLFARERHPGHRKPALHMFPGDEQHHVGPPSTRGAT